MIMNRKRERKRERKKERKKEERNRYVSCRVTVTFLVAFHGLVRSDLLDAGARGDQQTGAVQSVIMDG